MAGHGATVSQVVYRKRTVLSSSHDGTVRVWQMARGRRLMLNPWFSHLATLDVGSECGHLPSPPPRLCSLD